MTQNRKKSNANALLIASGTVVVISSAIAFALQKRQDKKEHEARLSHAVAIASFKEVSELFIEDLDRKIGIAKKALLDSDFNDIIEDF